MSKLQSQASRMNLRALNLNNRCIVAGYPIIVTAWFGSNSNDIDIIIKKIEGTDHKWISSSNTDAKIMEEIKFYCEPQFIQLDKICVDMIGETFYVDKEIAITVTSLSANTEGAAVMSGKEIYNVDRLWIKD